MTKGSTSATWVYGPDNQRVRQTLVAGGVTSVTDYLNGSGGMQLAFEAETKAGITENRHFLSAGGQVFAVYKTFSGPGAPAPQMRYLHPEVLGSTTAVTDETGALAERTVFDPWGKRQFLNGTPDSGNIQSHDRYAYVMTNPERWRR